MEKPAELLRQGRSDEVWKKYCGFLDITLDQFMEIQERLLLEQLQLMGRSELGRAIMGEHPPRSVEEFRQRVPITTYEDYAFFLDEQKEDVLPEKPVAWAHTSGRSGRYKWYPCTARAFAKIGEGVLSWLILSTTSQRGVVRIEPGDILVYNVAARPYMSGYGALSLAELFDMRYVPTVEEMEQMSFQERIQAGFRMGMRTGIDVVGSISSVLVKIGEEFSKGATTTKLTPAMLHPAVLARMGRAWVRSRLAGRPILPKDLWRVKGLLVSGTDTDIYRDRIREYWGVEPTEGYGMTEGPAAIAMQAWDRKGLYFLPDVSFLEFIPETEWTRWRADESYMPQTVLLSEVELGTRYEVVLTNFYGGPLMRYRLHDLVEFISYRDEEEGIALPSMTFAGRVADLIDLASFSGLIDEKLVWQAIANTGIAHEEWAVRKELLGEHSGLHL
ncbi:MAG: GH3 auxin-responsive promoter, partial [Planctomycetaceae bacterium]